MSSSSAQPAANPPAPITNAIAPNGTASNYALEKKIGKGQFSEVWRARDNRTGAIVALKRIPVRASSKNPWRISHENSRLKFLP